MKRHIIIWMVVFLSMALYSQDSVQENRWTGGTALSIPKNRWELALFAPSRVGLLNRLELSLHPLSVFILPQATIKIGWGSHAGFILATEHGLMIPTIYMNLVSTKGPGGLISPEFEIPFMLSVSNRMLVSYHPFFKALLTAQVGFVFAVKAASPDRRTTIDLPVIYPRFAVFYDQPVVESGIDFRGHLTPLFGWLFAVKNFMVCREKENYFMENKGMAVYMSKRGTLRMEAGYKLCFGRYPYGPQWHLLPALDLFIGF